MLKPCQKKNGQSYVVLLGFFHDFFLICISCQQPFGRSCFVRALVWLFDDCLWFLEIVVTFDKNLRWQQQFTNLWGCACKKDWCSLKILIWKVLLKKLKYRTYENAHCRANHKSVSDYWYRNRVLNQAAPPSLDKVLRKY